MGSGIAEGTFRAKFGHRRRLRRSRDTTLAVTLRSFSEGFVDDVNEPTRGAGIGPRRDGQQGSFEFARLQLRMRLPSNFESNF